MIACLALARSPLPELESELLIDLGETLLARAEADQKIAEILAFFDGEAGAAGLHFDARAVPHEGKAMAEQRAGYAEPAALFAEEEAGRSSTHQRTDFAVLHQPARRRIVLFPGGLLDRIDLARGEELVGRQASQGGDSRDVAGRDGRAGDAVEADAARGAARGTADADVGRAVAGGVLHAPTLTPWGRP
jgi:hypothetical protein